MNPPSQSLGRAPTAGPFRYDARTIALHWATATLVAILWCIGQSIDFFPKGMPRVSARSVHILLGCGLGMLVAYRIYWRAQGGTRPPASEKARFHAAARIGHISLYLGLCLVVALGLFNAWARGDSLFGVLKIPAFSPDDKDLRELVENAHAYAANALILIAAGHAVAALVHRFVLKDGVMARMGRTARN